MESYLKYLEAKEKPLSVHMENAIYNIELALKLSPSDSYLNDLLNSSKYIMNKYKELGK